VLIAVTVATCSILRVVYGNSSSKVSEGGRGVGSQDVKTGKVEKAVLLSLLLSYSNNNEISVCNSRLSFYSTYMFY